ncbi:MAG: AAA family ATPase [Dehalococcoidales bacterium]|nr:AAA family ATPase [Dehalococcoidales bacterium]
MGNIKISTNQFGPIKEAEIEVKPLTVFVGSNNTGKTYIAQLIYAISNVIRHLEEQPFPLFNKTIDVEDQTLREFEELLPEDLMDLVRRPASKRVLNLVYDHLPKQIKQESNEYGIKCLKRLDTLLASELERCFDTKISKLVCKGDNQSSLSIKIQNKLPDVNVSLKSNTNKLQIAEIKYAMQDEKIRYIVPRFGIPSRIAEQSDEAYKELMLRRILRAFIERTFSVALKDFPQHSYYLPAARSGILHGQKAIARVGLRTMQRAGIESISIPKMPGTIIDFLDAIFSIDKDENGDFATISRELENDLTNGRIEFVENKGEIPEIFFREPKIGRMSLHRTSSMISELAPIIVMLRYMIRSDDLLIIEEPESHMHPNAQRILAKALIRLANGGCKVLVTTHSDYFLQQLSNMTSLSFKSNEEIEKLGFASESSITPNEINVYLFSRDKNSNCTKVKQLEVNEKGILEEEFGLVAESLYEESLLIKGYYEVE